MRFLSDDGKVFNTAEECKEHEGKADNIKRRKEINKINELISKNMALTEQLNIAIDKYAEEYPDTWEDDLGIDDCPGCLGCDDDIFDVAIKGLLALAAILEDYICDEDDDCDGNKDDEDFLS